MIVVAYVGPTGRFKRGSSFTLVTFAIQFTTVLENLQNVYRVSWTWLWPLVWLFPN